MLRFAANAAKKTQRTMATRPSHTIHRNHCHFAWDRSLPPVLRAAPGETITFDITDASGGQITPQCTAEVFSDYDADHVNPVTGPVFVDGAHPGDTLVVKLESYAPSGWGWTANIPGFGLLADDFPDAALLHWKYQPDGSKPLLFADKAEIPLAPFAGTIGVAPAEPGPHSIIPPRHVGGNMDVRDLVAGSVLYLPVEVEGALFSIGDTHAAQGDGEVCGTAIESPMQASLTFEIIKGEAPKMPRIITPRRRVTGSTGSVQITTGIGPDLHEASRTAVRGMIDLAAKTHGLSAIDAYMLCSVAGDLRISQIVDAPNWTVSFHLPDSIFSAA
jgi:acetamidase/formamidase